MSSFFEQQAEARRNTRWLLVGMVASVLATGVGLYAVLLLLELSVTRAKPMFGYESELWHPRLFAICVFGSALFVAGASVYRMLSLRGGGSRVAEMMGGRLASGQPRDLLEQRLLNVVEEMAIASGVPVPQVFVMEAETGINAFAAGFSVDDAAVAVTRGALEKLTRSELQGVIAHEFSHVLNGDMRLNTRLMGAVFGVLCIGLCGRGLMRLASNTSGVFRSKNKGGGHLFALGLGVFVVGWLGELMGKLIKAAVSRQREFLADASAVQFTRDPSAVAGALKKIGGYSGGSRVAAAAADEASHLFFGDLYQRLFAHSWLATHPPLSERIARLDPGFGGEFAPVPEGIADEPNESPRSGAMGFAPQAAATSPAQSLPPGDIAQHIGSPDRDALAESRRQIAALPEALREAAASPFSAGAMVYGLWLIDASELSVPQCARIEASSGPQLRAEAQRLAPLLAKLEIGERLSLIELAAPALRQFSAEQRLRFARTIESLTLADRHTSIFEQVVGWMLSERLLGEPNARSRSRVRHKRLTAVRAELELVLSLLAHAGDVDGAGASISFTSAAHRLRGVQLQLLPASERLISGLGPALNELRALSPELAHQLVDACAHAVLSDHRVSADETTLLRAVCDALRCPLPLLAETVRAAS
ncbi:MAG TPA: M48 family metallopeptidase [Polyangiales bacterium]|nr:M48 family metallopeptidase [Polyangiales bacterium]